MGDKYFKPIATKTIMAMTFNANAQTFIPTWESNFNIHIPQMDSQLEYNDAFLEYAYENGLWGLPGATHEPSDNEMTDMRQRFADHWINIHGYNEHIDYYGEAEDDEDIFFPDNEEDNDAVIGEELDEVIREIDDVQIDVNNININNNHEQLQCAECGVQEGENVRLEDCPTSGEQYCEGCWNEYENREPSTMNWSDIATDFHDYCEYCNVFNDQSPEHLDFRVVEDAWESYVVAMFNEENQPWVYVLADSNDWTGVFTPAQTEAVRAYRLQ